MQSIARAALACFFVVAIGASSWVASAATMPQSRDFKSSDAILRFIYGYRAQPEVDRVPAAVRAMDQSGAFKDPESAGIYIGFIAGVLGSNPSKAEHLIGKMLQIPHENHWVIVRAVIYSGLPQWKALLGKFAVRMPTRRVMIEKAVTGKTPTLDDSALDSDAALLDTLWGYYFATGSSAPILRIVSVLPWSKDDDSIFKLPWSKDKMTVEKLTVGNMAKYTLASNATRDVKLLAILKQAVGRQPEKTAAILKEVIEAAETVETARIRKDALAAIETFKRKGSSHNRKLSWWGHVGEGAIAVGCVVAAATGQIQLGIPCVVGGAASSAALRFWSNAQ